MYLEGGAGTLRLGPRGGAEQRERHGDPGLPGIPTTGTLQLPETGKLQTTVSSVSGGGESRTKFRGFHPTR